MTTSSTLVSPIADHMVSGFAIVRVTVAQAVPSGASSRLVAADGFLCPQARTPTVPWWGRWFRRPADYQVGLSSTRITPSIRDWIEGNPEASTPYAIPR
jgi:hypothetical protein